MIPTQSTDASAGGTFLTTAQTAILRGARLAAAAAAASAILREGNGTGRILAKLSADVNQADEFRIPTAYSGAVHVTIAGAGAQLNLFS